jgi:hypothetical protein
MKGKSKLKKANGSLIDFYLDLNRMEKKVPVWKLTNMGNKER